MNFVKFLNDILREFLNVYYVKYLLLYGSNGSTVEARKPGRLGVSEKCPALGVCPGLRA